MPILKKCMSMIFYSFLNINKRVRVIVDKGMDKNQDLKDYFSKGKILIKIILQLQWGNYRVFYIKY